MNFSFDFKAIPVGLVTYPPDLSQPEKAVSKPEDNSNIASCKDKVKTILKQKKSILIKTDLKKIKKTIKWSTSHQARVMLEKKNINIDEMISEKELFSFLKRQGAIQLHLPGGDYDPRCNWSKDPEDVKEIKKLNNTPVGKIEDEELIKHYKRLMSKHQHIFSQKRSIAFQEIVRNYLKVYEKEINIRGLPY